MIAPYGFDLGQFVRPQQSESPLEAALAGQRLASEGQNRLQDTISMFMRQKMAREAMANDQAMLEEQLGQRSEQAALGEYAANQRKEAELAAAQRKFALEQAMKQREIEGGLVGDATKAFAVGDQAAIQAAQARAGVQAPSLAFSKMPGLNPMGLADPYASPGLNITRGDETLYSGSTAEQRRMQQETAKSLLEPLLGGSESSSFAPFVAAGINAAGLGGMSGVDAAKMAMEGGRYASTRDASRDNARQFAISKNEAANRANVGAERQYWVQIDKMAKDQATRFQNDVNLKKTHENIKNSQAVRSQIESGIPFSQNTGFLQILKANTSGAISDYETKNQYEAAGFLNALQLKIDRVINGGEIPPDFRDQIVKGLDLVDDYNHRVVKGTGLKAMDGLLMSPGFVAMVSTPEEAVMAALQSYQDVTGEPYSLEDMREEVKAYAPKFREMKGMLNSPVPSALGGGAVGGGGASVSMRGDIVPQNLGDLGGLGVAPVPPKANPNRAKALQLLERHRAGQ